MSFSALCPDHDAQALVLINYITGTGILCQHGVSVSTCGWFLAMSLRWSDNNTDALCKLSRHPMTTMTTPRAVCCVQSSVTFSKAR